MRAVAPARQLADPMFGLHLDLGGDARELVDVRDDRGIIHAAHTHHVILGELAAELLLDARSEFLFYPRQLEPHVIAKITEQLAVRRRVADQRADLGVDRPWRRAFAEIL